MCVCVCVTTTSGQTVAYHVISQFPEEAYTVKRRARNVLRHAAISLERLWATFIVRGIFSNPRCGWWPLPFHGVDSLGVVVPLVPIFLHRWICTELRHG